MVLAVSLLLIVSPLTDSSTENRPWLDSRVLNTGLVVWGKREGREGGRKGRWEGRRKFFLVP